MEQSRGDRRLPNGECGRIMAADPTVPLPLPTPPLGTLTGLRVPLALHPRERAVRDRAMKARPSAAMILLRLCALSAMLTASASASDWPTLGRSPTHEGYQPITLGGPL